MAYDKNVDYQQKINEAVAKGDYESASAYEKQRNEKIAAEGLSYEKTYKYSSKPYGVSDSAWAGTQEPHTVNDEVNKAQTNRDKAQSKYTDHTNKEMISSSTMDAINQTFKKPSAVVEADAWLSDQLQVIQSGKTSYSDQVRDMMDKIMNREKFSYDVDNDQLFQQALASAMNSGKQAMQDTIGQASALTGGYGSTYATSAGNQAYNAFIEDAYDNLPQYYQMALDAYTREGDEMYRQFGMVSELDDKEFNRNVAAYDATYQHRNTLYNEAYTQYRDSKSDAFSMAGIEMQQYAQESSDLYNLYTMASNTYESLYEKDYQSWADRVNNAWREVEVLNADAVAQRNYDRSVYESDRDFEQRKAEHADQMAYNSAVLNRSSSGNPDDFELNDIEKAKVAKMFKDGASDEEVLAYLYEKGKIPSEDDDSLIYDIKEQVEWEKQTPSVKGKLDGFRVKEGDNFEVKVGKESYKVENSGEVTDEDKLKKLKNMNVNNGDVFRSGNKIYVKYNDKYYSVGARERLGMWKTSGKSDLLTALQ